MIMKLKDFWDVTSYNWYMGTNISKEPATTSIALAPGRYKQNFYYKKLVLLPQMTRRHIAEGSCLYSR